LQSLVRTGFRTQDQGLGELAIVFQD